MEEQSLSEVLCDMRKAQRLVVAFNQHIMPVIDSMASKLNANFYYWEPQFSSNSCRGTTNPATKRKWSFSPLHNAAFLYLSDGVVGPNDLLKSGYLLVFHLVTDTAIDDAFERDNKAWSPLDIEQEPENSRSVLRVYAFQPDKEGSYKNGWWDLYADNPWPECGAGVVNLVQGGRALGLEFDISELGSKESMQTAVRFMENQLVENGFLQPEN